MDPHPSGRDPAQEDEPKRRYPLAERTLIRMLLLVGGVGLLLWVTWDSPDPGPPPSSQPPPPPHVIVPAPPPPPPN